MRNVAVPSLAAFVLLVSSSVCADDRNTAIEVTDRPTLREFVEGAKDYLEGVTTLSETARLRGIFRTEIT